VVMAVISIPSGSPFLGIPMGALVWFFVGTLQKLADEHRRGTLHNTAENATLEPVTPKRYLHRRTT
jgi:hypothetical protein